MKEIGMEETPNDSNVNAISSLHSIPRTKNENPIAHSKSNDENGITHNMEQTTTTEQLNNNT